MTKPTTKKKEPTGRTKLRLNPNSKARAPFMLLLSKDEKAQFTALAVEAGLPLSAWIRMTCLREVRAAAERK